MVDKMTSNGQEADGLTPQVRDVLGAYLDASMLAEGLQTELWRDRRLTLPQLLVLRSLRDGGPQLAGRLAEAAGLAPASATRVVDRLEERGLVRRHRDRDDRRCVEVQLTAEGRHLLGTVRVLHDSPLRHAVEAMSVAEQRSLAASLHRLARSARQLEQLAPRVAAVPS
jgi:DNA-binding MarR family transcriptional regulator